MDLKWKQWALTALFLLAGVAEATVFDVKNYSAKADGKTDIRKAVISAWNDACASVQPSTVLISKGTYLLGPVVLKGPCKTPSIEFQVQGLVQAPPDPAAFKTDGWIVFQYINGLTVSGGGTFDGQGQKAWTINNCGTNPNCRILPVSLRFNFVNNTMIQDITSLNSKNFHINIFQCYDLTLKNLNITAPGDSANTDGIHMGDSARIRVTDILIATGDDCISIGPGTRNLNVSRVICGPGHGISVGSLGKYKGEAEVNGIFVRNSTFINTQNGVRIKTWPSSPVGTATNIVFEDLIMNNVSNPVILDQEYCPHFKCTKKDPSLVKLSNIKFNKIRGTSSSQLAVVIACSKGVPCKNVKIGNINLKYNGIGGPAQSTSSNVKPILFGLQMPPIISI
ncbi:hypothetical protein NE237_026051 [Protea cynaroides]|uniref:Exopolygalacturonase-like n=1 Tax=Protea cynaroides TaxID=273540 RepID=A0A9Q0K1W9_9MAGN|nr:hypothetical protein NE237_026051 [Protea cynaroides]